MIKKKYLFYLLSLVFVLVSCTDTSDSELQDEYQQPQINKYGLLADTLIEDAGSVENNETLADILLSYGIEYPVIYSIANTCRDSFDVRTMKAGNNFSIFFTNDSLRELKYFVYEIDPVKYVVYNIADSVTLTLNKKPVEIVERNIAGVINSSLWETMQSINANPSLAIELSEVFAWQINFYGIQKGDRFKVLFKEAYVDSQFVGIKEITAAEFMHKGEVYNAIRFVQNGSKEYFDTSGLSLQKQFLKAPLKFSRISSRFTNSRLHPVLKIRRPHLGVDFAAPRGTPVMAIGDGDIVFKGYQNQEGNYIKIKHNGTYTSGYMHLSKFNSDISVGKRVRQGDIIGYVGSTGLSSGPHLDLRFWKNGQAVNYLTQEFPPTHPVSEENRYTFTEVVDSVLNQLSSVAYPDENL